MDMSLLSCYNKIMALLEHGGANSSSPRNVIGCKTTSRDGNPEIVERLLLESVDCVADVTVTVMTVCLKC